MAFILFIGVRYVFRFSSVLRRYSLVIVLRICLWHIWWPSYTPRYLYDGSFSNCCIVVSWSIFMLSDFVGLPCTNVHFIHLSRPNSIWMSSENRFTCFSCSVNVSSFSVMRLKSFMDSRWVTFPIYLDVLSLVVKVYPCPCLFMRLLSGSRVRQNKRGERLSPWKIPHLIFTFGISIFLSECSFAFSISLITWRLILYICMHFIIHECGTLSKAFLLSIQAVDSLALRILQFSNIIWPCSVVGGQLFHNNLSYIPLCLHTSLLCSVMVHHFCNDSW